VLDEATCHLNVEKEKDLLTAIRSLAMTRIIVAHRPETIAAVDRVIVLESGKVKWTGSPSLMEEDK